MLRNTAIYLISFSVAGAGYLYSLTFDLRVRKLEKIILFMSQIKTEIQFTADSVRNILGTILTGMDWSLLPFIRDCAEGMEKGEDVLSSWNSAISKRSNVRALKTEDIALLHSFGTSFGVTDSAGQIKNCEMHELLFREKLEAAISDKNKMSTPIKTCGILTGTALLIIFL